MKKHFGYVIERLEIGGKECYQALSFTANDGCFYTNLAKLIKDVESDCKVEVVFIGLCDTRRESLEIVNNKNSMFIDREVYIPMEKAKFICLKTETESLNKLSE